LGLIILFTLFIALLLFGVSVASSMMLASIVSIFLSGLPITIMAERMLGAVNSFTLLAVPFFIFAGVIMNRAGLTNQLVGVARFFVGHFRGGTAQVNVVASMFFSGISGSASADAAALGSMIIPSMKKEGYDAGFSAGITAASATIGPIIPPSIVMVIYGALTNMSIGALFIAGVIPGLMIGFALMGAVAVIARQKNYPRSERLPWRAAGRIILPALPALLAPVIILGGIFSGATTATEAGVIACVYGLIVGLFVYRDLRPRDLFPLLVETVEVTAVPVYILASAAIFGFVLTINGFGFIVGDALQGITDSPTVLLLIVIALLMFVGMFVEGTAALLIFVPVFMPLVKMYGLNEIQFALIVIVTILIGTVTPPVGLQLYIASSIARVPIDKVVVWPFVAVMLAVVLLMVFIPGIATWLPSVLL
jgi:tripartite ATP-independent transporter DctM subunit